MTAVEWLEQELIKTGLPFVKGETIEIEQAKEMEKQQIIDAWENGNHTEMRGGKVIKSISEQYYNETFKKK